MIDADAPLIVFDEIDSTNEEARRRAARGDLGPAWLLAKRQTAGRGRRGRSWTTIPGNMFLTYLGSSSRPAADIALLGFAAGVALAEQCDATLGAGRASLKWPNDLLLDGRKAAGILLESGPAGEDASPLRSLWFGIGIGFNLVGAPDDVGQPTASFAQFAPAPPVEQFARQVGARLATWAARLEHNGFDALRAAWEQRAHRLGEHIRVGQGEQMLEGRLRGLSPRGELELVLASGEVRLIAAGDVYFPELTTA